MQDIATRVVRPTEVRAAPRTAAAVRVVRAVQAAPSEVVVAVVAVAAAVIAVATRAADSFKLQHKSNYE